MGCNTLKYRKLYDPWVPERNQESGWAVMREIPYKFQNVQALIAEGGVG